MESIRSAGDGWCGRWFSFCLAVIDSLRAHYYTDELRSRTNLCFLLRTMVLSGPAVLFASLFGAVALPAVLTVIPIWLFGLAVWRSTLLEIVIIVGGMLLICVAAIVVIVGAFEARDRFVGWRASKMEPSERKAASLISLIAAWVKAKKENWCPEVVFSPPLARPLYRRRRLWAVLLIAATVALLGAAAEWKVYADSEMAKRTPRECTLKQWVIKHRSLASVWECEGETRIVSDVEANLTRITELENLAGRK